MDLSPTQIAHLSPENVARAILDQFWLTQVERIAQRSLHRHPSERVPMQMHPPREEDYAAAASALAQWRGFPVTDAVSPDAKATRVITRRVKVR